MALKVITLKIPARWVVVFVSHRLCGFFGPSELFYRLHPRRQTVWKNMEKQSPNQQDLGKWLSGSLGSNCELECIFISTAILLGKLREHSRLGNSPTSCCLRPTQHASKNEKCSILYLFHGLEADTMSTSTSRLHSALRIVIIRKNIHQICTPQSFSMTELHVWAKFDP